jgi:phosphatidate cytidylyltransferase
MAGSRSAGGALTIAGTGTDVAVASAARGMSAFWSRILVAIAGLPIVLGFAWLGGWWLVALAVVGGLLALHEYFAMIRELRPLALAGFAGLVLALLGAQLGGIVWMLGGFMSTFATAFLLHGIARTKSSATAAIGSTVVGVAWIALGLGHLLLLRDLEPKGRLAAFTVLIAVFTADTLAYFSGRLVGRHKLVPTLSPGKTWEGFVAGVAAAVFVTFVALYKQHFLSIPASIVLGFVIAFACVIGDLFESALKRDMQVKDTGSLLAGHGGVLDRIDSVLFAAVASFYAILALQ